MAMLKIPMYDQLKMVMFYDVLQQLCDKVNLMNFNKDKITEGSQKSKALKLMGAKGLKSDLELIMTANDTNAIDFAKTIREMGKLNPKIKLMMELQKGFKRVHETYAVYVDCD